MMLGPTLPPAAPLAHSIRRGTMRWLLELDRVALAEVTLPGGRRADLMAIGRGGEIELVEIKSSLADLRADRKWADYLEFSDRFYFAVAPGFPLAALPDDEGVVIADRYAATLHRPARHRPLPAQRRRMLLLRLARLGALRLHALADPDAVGARLED